MNLVMNGWHENLKYFLLLFLQSVMLTLVYAQIINNLVQVSIEFFTLINKESTFTVMQV